MKKNLLKFSLVLTAFLLFLNVSAQLVLPQPSPKASVMQTVGLTDITIDYSSPSVNGRTIWGDLVPYDMIWRAGANSATKITFSRDVTINDVIVPKGSYSIFIIPTQTEWTVIINKDATASTDAYKQEMDIVRIKVFPSSVPTVAISSNAATPTIERLTYNFSDFTNEMSNINLSWEKVKISFSVKVDTDKQANENIEKATSGVWSIYNNSARYFFDKKEYDKALNYVNQSISNSDQWFNNWVKAQILNAQGKKNDAYNSAKKAKELGDKSPAGSFFYKVAVYKALIDWAPDAPLAPKKK